LPVRRPTGAEVEVIGMTGDPHPVSPCNIAGPDLIAAWTCQVVGDASAIRAKAQPIGQSLSSARKLLCIASVQVHAEDLADPITYDLHQDTFVADKQRRRVEHCQAVAIGDLG